jgi:membrane-associated phospholipid phosphatase
MEAFMDYLVQIGVNWVIAIQGLGAWLKAPMEFFSFLGQQDFFFLVLPLIYWCIEASLGMRVAFILITSASVNSYFKLLFAGPRPYWVSDKVMAYAAETSFGVPSGHAQNAVSVWGVIAARIGRAWAWVAALTLAFLISFSRWYLGVHFPHDVFVGWALGALILWAFIRFENPTVAWFKSKTFGAQALTAFVLSLVLIGLGGLTVASLMGYTLPQEYATNALRAHEMPDPVSMEGFVTSGGTLFGLIVGATWIMARGGYQASGPIEKRVLRFVVGVAGVIAIRYGLDAIFPDGTTLVPMIFRYIRYALVGFWIMGGAPWLFFRFKLADEPNM